MRHSKPFAVMLFLLGACQSNDCPAPEDRFVPAPDPDMVFEWDDEFTTCSGDRVPWAEVHVYYEINCESDWCDPAYVGRRYCVSKQALNDWLAQDCLECIVEYGHHGVCLSG